MRYNSFLHIFPEQCAKYLHDKFKMHSNLTVRELMVILKRIGIKTIKIHNNGKIYDVFYKREIDGIQDFEFLNNLYQYRRDKQIRNEWSKEPLIDYTPELSNMQNASDELLGQDEVYYTNESKQIKYNMKKDNKKALYESIMTSVAKEVKKVLNEDFDDEDVEYAEDDFEAEAEQYGIIYYKDIIMWLEMEDKDNIELYANDIDEADCAARDFLRWENSNRPEYYFEKIDHSCAVLDAITNLSNELLSGSSINDLYNEYGDSICFNIKDYDY